MAIYLGSGSATLGLVMIAPNNNKMAIFCDDLKPKLKNTR
jgi:hypothetical protein